MPRGPKPLTAKLKQDEFYCVKCRKRTKSPDFVVKKIKNSKRKDICMMKGTCKKCGTNVNKFISKDKYEELK
jgi:hypothetical protein